MINLASGNSKRTALKKQSAKEFILNFLPEVLLIMGVPAPLSTFILNYAKGKLQKTTEEQAEKGLMNLKRLLKEW